DKADPRQLGWLLGAALPLPTATRQDILEHDRVSARLRQLVAALQHEIAVRQLIGRITSETAEEMTRSQRDAILRRHMESIQRELGEGGANDVGELRAKLEKLALSDEVRKETEHELDRLEHMPEASPEHGMIRAYVDWILKLPWGKHTGESIDVDRARRVLDEDHFDLERIKDR